MTAMVVDIDDNTLASWQRSLFNDHFYNVSCVSHDYVISRKHFSALLALCEGNPPVTGGFASQRPVTQSFDVFVDLRLIKRLSKQSKHRWLETPPRSLWRHCNVLYRTGSVIPNRCIDLWFWKICFEIPLISTHCQLIVWTADACPSRPNALRWRHMSTIMSEINGISTIHLTVCWG